MERQPQPPRDSFVDRAWSVVTAPASVGVLVSVTGAICVVVAVASAGDGWLEPLRPTFALPAVAGLLGGAAVLAAGAYWERWRRSRPGPEATGWSARAVPAVGVLCAVVGVGLLIANWLMFLRASPPGEMILNEGDQAEAFEGSVAGESVEIMLPARVRLDGVEVGSRPTVELAFSEPGSDPFRRARLAAGQTTQIEGLRIAPVGLAADSGALRATISSEADETITATVATGDTFRLRPNGPEYQVRDIVENYLESLGPAVKVESPERGAFWLFGRSGGPKEPEFIHDLRVERLERAPGVVFSVAPVIPRWPAGTGGVLLLLGFAVVLVVPERVRIDIEEEGERPASFNDAGRMYGERRATKEES